MAVAVIVPVYGPAPYLEEALQGVLGQDPPPGEVVVVDDASTEPVRLPPPAAERCTLVRRSDRGGPAAARDAGLEASSGELVALADADDVWEPGKLAVQAAALRSNGDVAVCFGRAVVVDADGAPTGERWEELRPGPLEPAELVPLLFERNPIPASSAVVRRGALEAAGGFAGSVELGSDWELWLRLAGRGERFLFEPRAAIGYRRHRGGVTFDVAALAEAKLAIHAAHAGLVDEATRRRAEAQDRIALARGRIRQRRYADAREELRRAASLAPLSPRDRAMGMLLRAPGLRGLLGRRDPYRRRPRRGGRRGGRAPRAPRASPSRSAPR